MNVTTVHAAAANANVAANANAAAHPFEVVHVGGLHRSADERQVVDFRRLLVSLV